ncbi:kinase-like domain-containing protein [Gigaspora rosea]|uniref:Kinase-like domain-containing protein n=1 Tax=Gigaspora rosea TaxID=44941 RepID=A0A397V582_9GLOM|nr:kinase-like domain-containing protein [Gigaspora rosea]
MEWKDKLTILLHIIFDLQTIHSQNFIHRDLHSGNILQNSQTDANIADLGLLKSVDTPEYNGVYGVLPYIAPEVLIGKPYTAASDIYSFGIIMWEISSGKPSYYDRKHDGILAKEIYDGLRPTFAKEIPLIYVQLANQCMSANASERPSASDLQEYIDSWAKKAFYIKIFKDADININKHESESSNNCINTMFSYKSIARLIGSEHTNLKDSSENQFCILDNLM